MVTFVSELILFVMRNKMINYLLFLLCLYVTLAFVLGFVYIFAA